MLKGMLVVVGWWLMDSQSFDFEMCEVDIDSSLRKKRKLS